MFLHEIASVSLDYIKEDIVNYIEIIIWIVAIANYTLN